MKAKLKPIIFPACMLTHSGIAAANNVDYVDTYLDIYYDIYLAISLYLESTVYSAVDSVVSSNIYVTIRSYIEDLNEN